jgi:hypothetical protein
LSLLQTNRRGSLGEMPDSFLGGNSRRGESGGLVRFGGFAASFEKQRL